MTYITCTRTSTLPTSGLAVDRIVEEFAWASGVTREEAENRGQAAYAEDKVFFQHDVRREGFDRAYLYEEHTTSPRHRARRPSPTTSDQNHTASQTICSLGMVIALQRTIYELQPGGEKLNLAEFAPRRGRPRSER